MKLTLPVTNHQISQPFGVDRTADPLYGQFYTLFANQHCGVDFAVPVGTPVAAAYPGLVIRREFHPGMGNVLGLVCGHFVFLYAHLSHFEVNLGDFADIGQLLGLSGATGAALISPHLHFEIRDLTRYPLKNQVFDPPFDRNLETTRLKYLPH